MELADEFEKVYPGFVISCWIIFGVSFHISELLVSSQDEQDETVETKDVSECSQPACRGSASSLAVAQMNAF